MRVVIVNGLPGVGKTSLAARIAAALGWPLLTKDMLKEQLFDSIGWGDRAWSRKLSRASLDLLFLWLKTEAAAQRDIVIEGNFESDRDTPRFLANVGSTPVQWTQIVVGCDGDVLVARHRARALSGRRHPGHQEAALINELTELLQTGWVVPLALPGATIAVDTTDFAAFDPAAVIQQVRAIGGIAEK